MDIQPPGGPPSLSNPGAGRILALAEDGLFHLTREWRPHAFQGPRNARHDTTVEVCLIEEGHELIEIDGRAHRVQAGQYVLIPAGCIHSSSTGSKPCTETILHLPGSEFREAARALGGSRATELLPAGVYRAPVDMTSMFTLFVRAATRPDSGARMLLLEALAAHLSVWLLQQHGCAGSLESEPPVTSTIRGVLAAEAAMRAELDRSHRLDDLASTAGLSRYHFLRLFKRTFGAPPHEHLLRLRVAEAARLLATTRITATAIAFEVGFASSSGLSSAFKRFQGVTPDAWRRRHGLWQRSDTRP